MERSKELSMNQAFLQKLTDSVFNNLKNEQFGVEELASDISMRRSQIHRRLHKINGQSVSQFIREIRLKEAHRLLENSTVTASEIAYQVGFSSPAYFTKCFHEFYGYTPGDLRNKEIKKRILLKLSLGYLGKPAVTLAVIAFFLLAIFTLWSVHRKTRIRWAIHIAIPEIEHLINEANYSEAYELAVRTDKYIPTNPELINLIKRVSSDISIHTDPSGAKIYAKQYKKFNTDWKYLGRSPIDSLRLPRNFYRWMIVKEGYDTVMAVLNPLEDTLFRKLDQKGTFPAGMVRVNGAKTEDGMIPDFFIDRYEVTNAQFKVFVDAGGYQNKAYWKYPFILDGVEIEFEEAINLFCDQTNRPGPATWKAGGYPEGEDHYPVSGISWYEAAAYVEFAGKELPTIHHWQLAAGMNIRSNCIFQSQIIPLSNCDEDGTVPVGRKHGMNYYGAYDMAGNVKEWCWNESKIGRVIRGGGWNDAPYMYTDESHLPPFDRSSKNGFRCAKYIDRTTIPEKVFQPVPNRVYRDYYAEKPPSDEVFAVYKNQFVYDPTELKAKEEIFQDSSENYTIERITYSAAYGDQRIIAFLYLPKNAAPPFQTVIYFPHAWAFREVSILESAQFREDLEFVVNNGRAVMFPVYIGVWDRYDAVNLDIAGPAGHREFIVKMVKDFERSIDYLETRSDIDFSKLAYYGVSVGGWMGIPIMAVEDRVKTGILVLGGLRPYQAVIPEADPFNYVSRVTEPVIMLNGRYDSTFPYEISVKPMYDLLGTPEQDKELKLYDTDHYIPSNERMKETLNWLDKQLGLVEKRISMVQ